MAVDTNDLTLYVDEEELAEVEALVEKAWNILQRDKPKLQLIDDYVNGKQSGPYVPNGSSKEYELLAERSITNVLDVMLGTPAQSLFVEGYREMATAADLHPQEPGATIDSKSSLWSCWQRNGLDAKQVPIVREACKSGLAFVGVQMPVPASEGKIAYDYPRAFTLSAMRTVALYEDPANDDWPLLVFTVDRLATNDRPGRARLWDSEKVTKFEIDANGKMLASIPDGSGPHGFDRVPIVPFNCTRDLEGRTRGIIEGLITTQDRLNQTIFDLLVAQTFGSFRVRYATGMTPPPQMERVPILVGDIREKLADGHPLKDAPSDSIYGYRSIPVLDTEGNPVPAAVTADAARFLVAVDPETTFGDLPPTPLDGFIESAGMTLTHMAIMGHLPPYYLLGDIANLSADALSVAESSLQRLIAQLQHTIGESWERVMQLFAQAIGREPDFSAEVMWRDMSPRSFASTVDGLVKLVEVGIVPRTAARDMVPGTTSGRIASWREAEDEEVANPTDPRAQLGKAVNDANISAKAASGRTRQTGAEVTRDAA